MRLSTLGLISVIAGAISVAPAFAGTPASISGSSTLVTAAGFTSTVSGESILPSGFIFSTIPSVLSPAVFNPVPAIPVNTSATLTGSQVLVAPAYNILGTSPVVTSLSVGSSIAPSATTTSASFAAAATALLTTLSNPLTTVPNANIILNRIEGLAGIIKAGAGVNGLD